LDGKEVVLELIVEISDLGEEHPIGRINDHPTEVEFGEGLVADGDVAAVARAGDDLADSAVRARGAGSQPVRATISWAGACG
jgi:hypothetical protein